MVIAAQRAQIDAAEAAAAAAAEAGEGGGRGGRGRRFAARKVGAAASVLACGLSPAAFDPTGLGAERLF